MVVQLPTTTKGKLESQRLVRKKGGFYSEIAHLGEWGILVSKLISFRKAGQSPAILSLIETKGIVLSSCSHLKYHLLGPVGGFCAVIQVA